MAGGQSPSSSMGWHRGHPGRDKLQRSGAGEKGSERGYLGTFQRNNFIDAPGLWMVCKGKATWAPPSQSAHGPGRSHLGKGGSSEAPLSEKKPRIIRGSLIVSCCNRRWALPIHPPARLPACHGVTARQARTPRGAVGPGTAKLCLPPGHSRQEDLDREEGLQQLFRGVMAFGDHKEPELLHPSNLKFRLCIFWSVCWPQ